MPGLTEKYQEYFIKKYSLKEKFYINNPLVKVIDKQRNNDMIIVGVHIRRGDYKYYRNGIFYYDDSVYLKYMKSIEIKINDSLKKECFFVIFSDETVTIKGVKNMIVSKNKWYIDHMLMGKCDLLIGPPSTFTLWASYIGKVKYFYIQNKSGGIDFDDFVYATGLLA